MDRAHVLREVAHARSRPGEGNARGIDLAAIVRIGKGACEIGRSGYRDSDSGTFQKAATFDRPMKPGRACNGVTRKAKCPSAGMSINVCRVSSPGHGAVSHVSEPEVCPGIGQYPVAARRRGADQET